MVRLGLLHPEDAELYKTYITNNKTFVWTEMINEAFDYNEVVKTTNNSSNINCLINSTSENCLNVSNSTDGYGAPFSLPATIFIAVCLTTCILLTIFGNLLVLLAFICERAIRQPSNYFIASLAVTDILIGGISLPFYTVYVLVGYWDLGPILCDLWLSVDYTVCLVSQFTVLLITVDRFCSVKIAARYRAWRTKGKVIILVLVTWIIPALLFFISIFGWQHFIGYRDLEEGECAVQFLKDPVFNTSLIVGYYWIPLIILFFLYGGIYQTAYQMSKKSALKKKQAQAIMAMKPVALNLINANRDNKAATESRTATFKGEGEGAACKAEQDPPAAGMTVSKTQVTLISQDKPKVEESPRQPSPQSCSKQETISDKQPSKQNSEGSTAAEKKEEILVNGINDIKKRSSVSSESQRKPSVISEIHSRYINMIEEISSRSSSERLTPTKDLLGSIPQPTFFENEINEAFLCHTLIKPISTSSAVELLRSGGILITGIDSPINRFYIIPPPAPSCQPGVNPVAASTPITPPTFYYGTISPPSMFADKPIPRPTTLDLKKITSPLGFDSVSLKDNGEMKYLDESSIIVPSPIIETPNSLDLENVFPTSPTELARCLSQLAANSNNAITLNAEAIQQLEYVLHN